MNSLWIFQAEILYFLKNGQSSKQLLETFIVLNDNTFEVLYFN